MASRCPLVQTYDKIFGMKLEETDDVAAFEQNAVNLMRTALISLDSDKLWGAALIYERILKSMQDICFENTAGHNNKLVALELNSVDQLKYCVEVASSHPLLEIEWVRLRTQNAFEA